MDLEQFKDDMSFGADMVGVAQRRQLQKTQEEIKGLLQKQQEEKDRQNALPKCPACQKPLELRSKKCASCHDGITWCLGLPFRDTQPNEELTEYALRHAQKTLTAIAAYDTIGMAESLANAHDALVSCAESAVEHMGSLSEYEAAKRCKSDTDNAIARIKRNWWLSPLLLPFILLFGLMAIEKVAPALVGVEYYYDNNGWPKTTDASHKNIQTIVYVLAGVCVAVWPAAYWLSRHRIKLRNRMLVAMAHPANYEAIAMPVCVLTPRRQLATHTQMRVNGKEQASPVLVSCHLMYLLLRSTLRDWVDTTSQQTTIQMTTWITGRQPVGQPHLARKPMMKNCPCQISTKSRSITKTNPNRNLQKTRTPLPVSGLRMEN